MNVDPELVDDFGEEWSRFDQSAATREELARQFEEYFAVFPWSELAPEARGFDLGCGTGRWARFVAPRVRELHCIDPAASALAVARRNLAEQPNCRFHQADASCIPLADASMDFGYALGVLHHLPDPQLGLQGCVRKLRPGAPFLVYLYYAFDNRPAWFRAVWKLTDFARRALCQLPRPVKHLACDVLAAVVYWPLARGAWLLERLGLPVGNIPLSAYRDKSFYLMRNDALDRFGTRIEHRFTRQEIRQMMLNAGLRDVRFHDREPYWCAFAYRV
ncbi:MAG: hypothetical protein AMXMBFR33_12260 [Candidatus Xenobia bacterium]